MDARNVREGMRVRLPEGTETIVVGETEDGLVTVKLDGEAIGHYPAEALTAIDQEG